MKTVLLCRVDGNFGGVERHILTVARHLDRTRFRPVIVVLCREEELAGRAREAGINTRRIPMEHRGDVLRATFHLRDVVQEEDASLIHTFGIRSSLLAYGVRFWHRVPWVIRVPNINSTDYSNAMVGQLAYQFNNFLLRNADAVQVISPQLESTLKRMLFPPGSLHVIPNGVDTDELALAPSKNEARRALGLPDQATILGSIGRLAPVKGYDRLIDALPDIRSRIPDAHVVIAGDGPERQPLTRRIRENGLDEQVHLLPFQNDIRPVLSALDVYVCSSRSEGVPFSILEAMAVGLPILAPRVGGIESILTHEQNALLMPNASLEHLVQGSLRLLTSDELSRTLSQNARKDAESIHSARTMTARVQDMYDSLISL